MDEVKCVCLDHSSIETSDTDSYVGVSFKL